MNRIQANKSGSRWIEVSDENLLTIRKYSLFLGLIDSNGIVSEQCLDKLKLNVRSLLTSAAADKALLDLCIDVIYHKDMKAFGLEKLVLLYNSWNEANPEQNQEEHNS